MQGIRIGSSAEQTKWISASSVRCHCAAGSRSSRRIQITGAIWFSNCFPSFFVPSVLNSSLLPPCLRSYITVFIHQSRCLIRCPANICPRTDIAWSRQVSVRVNVGDWRIVEIHLARNIKHLISFTCYLPTWSSFCGGAQGLHNVCFRRGLWLTGNKGPPVFFSACFGDPHLPIRFGLHDPHLTIRFCAWHLIIRRTLPCNYAEALLRLKSHFGKHRLPSSASEPMALELTIMSWWR